MPSFSSIHLALQAILTHQQAMEVVEHNVANSATPGYHRQEAVLRAGPPQGSPGLYASTISGMVGTGVMLDEVRRYSMEFVDNRYRGELAESKRWDIEKEYLTQIEGAMDETGSEGLNAKLDEFWSGWKAASTSPEDLTVRSDLLERAKNLAEALNGRVERLNALQTDKNLAMIQRVDEINQLSTEIAQLNNEIGKYKAPGTQANDFQDQLDQKLERLSEIAGAKVYFENNGQAMVSIGGHVLVQGITAHKLNTTPEPTNYNLVNIYWEDGQTLLEAGGISTLTSGELAGLAEGRDVTIPEQKRRLDNLATELADSVNTLHRTGYGLNESITYDPANPPAGAQRDFFTISDPLNPALSLRVNGSLEDVSLISLSSIQVPAGAVAGTTLTAASGDGTLAEKIFNLQTSSVTFPDGTADTFNHYNNMRVSALGLTVSKVNGLSTQHNNLLEVLNQQRESVNGVSLDEEAANMLKYQRSYQAAVRLMTTVDEMMDRIINGLGIVGR
jgi:flagellar hook-associated protein 1